MDYNGQAVVVTGGASGIGLAIAEKWVKLGSSVLISDVRPDALKSAGEKLLKQCQSNQRVVTLVSDVTDLESMKQLSETALQEFGRVDLVFLNAGVYDGGKQYENLSAWKWVMNVNVLGVVHGLHCFVPLFIDQIKKGHPNPVHIVTTASIASFLTAVLGTYSVSKFAVAGVMESLYNEVQQMGPQISDQLKVHCLHPPFVSTPLVHSTEQIRPGHAGESNRDHNDKIFRYCSEGLTVEKVADAVHEALEKDDFYIHPDAETSEACLQTRMDGIVQARVPNIVWESEEEIMPEHHESKL